MKLNPIVIYGLFDPTDPEHCRYVGQACRLTARLNRHFSRARNGERTHKSSWFRKVWSPEERLKLSIAHRGQKTSAVTRKKPSESIKRFWESLGAEERRRGSPILSMCVFERATDDDATRSG